MAAGGADPATATAARIEQTRAASLRSGCDLGVCVAHRVRDAAPQGPLSCRLRRLPELGIAVRPPRCRGRAVELESAVNAIGLGSGSVYPRVLLLQ
jgi:hypothetical protein